MDVPAPVAAWIVLGVALLALAVVVAGLVLTRPHRPEVDPDTDPAEPPSAAPGRPAGPHWAQDDLPGFAAAPPGTPPVTEDDEEVAAPGPPVTAGPSLPDPAPRAVAGLTAAALALVAGLAGLSLTTGGGDPAGGQDPPAAAATAPPPSPRAPAPPPAPPDLPAVPADPLPGEQGAGALAARSVPLGEDGVTARLTLDGLVLEQRAVGVTVTYPAVSVTVGGDGTALAHVRLPTWNCLGTTAPADPAAAGCTPTGVEYADLPTPALDVTRDGAALRLTGRFPTYTRPNGTPPAYTGRVYPLTVTAAPAASPRDGEAPAEGVLVLGTERAGTVGDRTVSRIRVAG